jgi:Zn-dependent peptidase ImmA (M78 family)/transcriptional regulator with XRE-family HTH domain
MPVRVDVNPELLAWARQRSGLAIGDLAHRFPKLAAWEQGQQLPTFKQLESYAQATHTPVGFLFLPEPPQEQVPIPDYRTIGDSGVRRPSPDLLDTIYQCEQRQDWYREFAQVNQEEPVEFVGSLTTAAAVIPAAAAMREALGFGVEDRGSTWSDALRVLIDSTERLGFLVMVNGVKGSNTHRKLDPGEFRGFALVDRLAPLVFVNGADTKAAQIFTLVHELAHLWLGEAALDDGDLISTPPAETERWCNQVAAEVLLPLSAVTDDRPARESLTAEIERLAQRFKVSTLVALRRIYDTRRLSWNEYRTAYQAELERVMGLLGERASGGGNFFNTQPARVSRRFTRAVITSTLEGQTLYRDAFQMLGFKKTSTFNELASRLGIS